MDEVIKEFSNMIISVIESLYIILVFIQDNLKKLVLILVNVL